MLSNLITGAVLVAVGFAIGLWVGIDQTKDWYRCRAEHNWAYCAVVNHFTKD